MIDLQYFKFEFLRWWERRSFNPWVKANPLIVLGILGVILAIVIVGVVWYSLPEKEVDLIEYEQDWYYDLNTGKLFTADAGQSPPIQAPSGPLPDGRPAGVRAYVFSYSGDPNASDRFTGFLETTDPNAPDVSHPSVDLRYEGAEKWARGHLVRRPGDKRWFPADSRMGRAVMRRSFRPNEQGQMPKYYPPEMVLRGRSD